MSIGDGAERMNYKDAYLTYISAKRWVRYTRYSEWACNECAGIEDDCAEFMERHKRLSQIILAFDIDPVRIVLKIINFAKFYKIQVLVPQIPSSKECPVR
jgi:hypothetical protein